MAMWKALKKFLNTSVPLGTQWHDIVLHRLHVNIGQWPTEAAFSLSVNKWSFSLLYLVNIMKETIKTIVDIWVA